MVRRLLYILIGVAVIFLILVVISLFTFLPMITSAHTSQATPTPTATTPATTPTPAKQSGNAAATLLKQYGPDIKTQIAQGLKLTPDALTAQLKTGKTLGEVAMAQGVSTTQLQTIIGNALKTGLQPAVDDGTLTQKQLNNLVKRYEKNPALLDKLLGGKAVKAAPTITPIPAQ